MKLKKAFCLTSLLADTGFSKLRHHTFFVLWPQIVIWVIWSDLWICLIGWFCCWPKYASLTDSHVKNQWYFHFILKPSWEPHGTRDPLMVSDAYFGNPWSKQIPILSGNTISAFWLGHSVWRMWTQHLKCCCYGWLFCYRASEEQQVCSRLLSGCFVHITLL